VLVPARVHVTVPFQPPIFVTSTFETALVLGPLARALGLLRIASLFNAIGAAVALPTYVTLPFLLLSA
jgi:hypothetical protein